MLLKKFADITAVSLQRTRKTCFASSSKYISPITVNPTDIFQKKFIRRNSMATMTKDPSGMLLPSFFISKKEKTFQYDESLPPLPIPPLQQTLRKYLESVEPHLTKEELSHTRSLVEKFAEKEGKELHFMLMEKAKYCKNWLETWWEDYGYLYNREPHSPYVNFSGPAPYAMKYWPPDESKRLERGGLVMWCCIKYWQNLRREQLVVDRGGLIEKNVWSMSQFRRMFNSCKMPGEHKDYFKFNFKTESEGPCSSHVVVLRHGRMFTFEALDQRGEVITAPELQLQLERIMQRCEGQPHGPGLGSLTGHRRTDWYKARQHLIELDQNNEKHLHVIETAIYCLALDDATPTSMTEVSRLGLMGDCRNRWLDKNMCHILFKNGLLACNCDHAAHDAMIMISATLWNFVIVEENKFQWQGTKEVREFPAPEELVFRVDSKIHQCVDEAVEIQKQAAKAIEIINGHYTNYGRKWTRKFKIHPDAHVQVAGQYAYYRIYGRPAATYETGSTRKYYNARTDTVRSCTTEALEFSRAMMEAAKTPAEKYKLLQAAYSKHLSLQADAQNGMAIDRHLLGLQLIAVEAGKPVPEIFNDPAWKKSGGGGNFTLSTSFVGYTEVFGGVAPMCPHGYGYFYSIQNDQISYFMSTWAAEADTSAKMMFDTVSKCLDDMKQLVEANASSTVKHTSNI